MTAARNILPAAAAAVMLAASAAWGAVTPPQPLSAAELARIDRAVAAALDYLRGQIGPDGKAKGEYAADNIRFGGKTGVCLYGMIACGLDARDEAVRRAAGWLSAAQLKGTYAVAMRACALAELGDKDSLALLAKDVAWLVKAAGRDGSYTYGPLDGKDAQDYDNSNAQLAVLAVWLGARQGAEVPGEYWVRTWRHWSSQQQGDGGFGYFIPKGDVRAKTYGSMTAAGLATMYICRDMLQREEYVRCGAPPDSKSFDDALKWLSVNYRDDENPRLGGNWYHYWLFCLERVALAGGHKYVGGATGTPTALASCSARPTPTEAGASAT